MERSIELLKGINKQFKFGLIRELIYWFLRGRIQQEDQEKQWRKHQFIFN
jgi:hypothetical protein